MLRVGLTGEMGSGKTTVARLLATYGATIFSSDEMGRAMMQPGQAVYQAIVDHFGPGVLQRDGHLDRPALARLAFDPAHPRVEELNAIVHPAVLAEQERLLQELTNTEPNAIAVVESALLFTTKHAGSEEPWRRRFDRIITVTAPDEVKIARFVERSANGRLLVPAERAAFVANAKARLDQQRSTQTADYTLQNNSGMDELKQRVEALWTELKKLTTSKLGPPKLNELT